MSLKCLFSKTSTMHMTCLSLYGAVVHPGTSSRTVAGRGGHMWLTDSNFVFLLTQSVFQKDVIKLYSLMWSAANRDRHSGFTFPLNDCTVLLNYITR